jgi:hypothetical protein
MQLVRMQKKPTEIILTTQCTVCIFPLDVLTVGYLPRICFKSHRNNSSELATAFFTSSRVNHNNCNQYVFISICTGDKTDNRNVKDHGQYFLLNYLYTTTGTIKQNVCDLITYDEA